MSNSERQPLVEGWESVPCEIGKVAIYVSENYPKGSSPIALMAGLGEGQHTVKRAIENLGLPLVGIDISFTDTSDSGLIDTSRQAPTAGVRAINQRLEIPKETPMDIVAFSVRAGMLALTAEANPDQFGNLVLKAPAGTTPDYYYQLAQQRLKRNKKINPLKEPNTGLELGILLATAFRQRRLELDFQPEPETDKSIEGLGVMIDFTSKQHLAPILANLRRLREGSGYLTNAILYEDDLVFPLEQASLALDQFKLPYDIVPGLHPSLLVKSGVQHLKATAEELRLKRDGLYDQKAA